MSKYACAAYTATHTICLKVTRFKVSEKLTLWPAPFICFSMWSVRNLVRRPLNSWFGNFQILTKFYKDKSSYFKTDLNNGKYLFTVFNNKGYRSSCYKWISKKGHTQAWFSWVGHKNSCLRFSKIWFKFATYHIILTLMYHHYITLKKSLFVQCMHDSKYKWIKCPVETCGIASLHKTPACS